MTRPLRQVLLAYSACVLCAGIYVPWQALPNIPAVNAAWVKYDFFWQPPQNYGYRHELATDRLLAEIASLTAVLLLAAWRLRDGGEE